MDDGAVLVYHIVRSNGVGARVGIRRSIGARVGIRSSVGGLLITTGGILRLAACDYAKDHHGSQHQCKELCKFDLHVFSSLFFYILPLMSENIMLCSWINRLDICMVELHIRPFYHLVMNSITWQNKMQHKCCAVMNTACQICNFPQKQAYSAHITVCADMYFLCPYRFHTLALFAVRTVICRCIVYGRALFAQIPPCAARVCGYFFNSRLHPILNMI